MPIAVLMRERVARTKPFVAPLCLLLCSLLPAASLLLLQFGPPATVPDTPLARSALVVFPLAIFLLSIFLWQARTRIAELEKQGAEAAQNAEIDPLSNLPNRHVFQRRLASAIANSTAEASVALIAIDIDNFKHVNDKHGHSAGDLLIVNVADRLKQVTRESDCLSRIGGDEFAVILVGIRSANQCAAMAQRIQEAMMPPFDVGNGQIFATLSLGIALCPQNGDTLPTLTQAADLALYRAKREGRNRFAFFDKTMEQTLQLGLTIEDDLRAAIENNDLTIAYQPLVSAFGRRLQGLEALVRWIHPQLGLISPDEFIPLAENRGLIVQLGEWVLSRACRDARRWPHLRMAVNVSPVQFRQPDFVQTVKRIIDESGINPLRLDLELTEGVLIQDSEQAEKVIIELRALGIRMGLDDFGAGYSSMIYLRRFAFDKIKIDRSFLQSMEAAGEGAIMLEHIVNLGHALGLTVTAEGIECQEQVEFLEQIGCDEMQGFYFAPPLSADAIDEFTSLQAWAHTPDDVPETDRSAA